VTTVKSLRIALVLLLLVQAWGLASHPCYKVFSAEDSPAGLLLLPLSEPVERDDCHCVMCTARTMTMYAPRATVVDPTDVTTALIAPRSPSMDLILVEGVGEDLCHCCVAETPDIYELACLRL
jgi:hypothetical protein